MAQFKTFDAALAFGRTEGREHIWPFQAWRIVRQGKGFALAIVNRNSGKVEGFIHA